MTPYEDIAAIRRILDTLRDKLVLIDSKLQVLTTKLRDAEEG